MTLRALVFCTLLVGAATLHAVPASAATLDVSMTVDERRVTVGETVQLDVELRASGITRVDELTLPPLDDFELVNKSEQRFNINGAFTLHKVFVLRATTVGRFTLAGASARAGRQSAHADPIVIEVAADEGAAATASTPTGAGPGARFGARLPSLFLERSAEPENAVVGQPIIVTTRLYTQQSLATWPEIGTVQPKGFITERSPAASRRPGQRTVGGRLYYVYPLARDVLVPQQPGDTALPVAELQVDSGGFFGQGRTERVTSQVVNVHVRSVPEAPVGVMRPPGNVGAFVLRTEAVPAQVPLGQSFTLKIAAQGHGNLLQLELPAYVPSPSVRAFPAQRHIDTDETIQDANAGTVSAEQLVQPNQPGDLVIPALALSFFDPDTQQTRTVTSAPLHVRVVDTGVRAGSDGGHAVAQTLGAGIKPLRLHVQQQEPPNESPVAAGAVLFALGGVALVGARVAAGRTRAREGSAGAARKSRTAALAAARARADLGALHVALLDAIARVAGEHARALPAEPLRALLLSNGADAALGEAVHAVLSDIAAARYAPRAGASLDQLFSQGTDVLARLDTLGDAPSRRPA